MTRCVSFHFDVEDDDDGARLDVFLAEQEDPPLSRSQVKRCIEEGEILVNDDEPHKAGYKLRTGDRVVWEHQPPRPTELIAQDIPLDILYEDDSVAIVNKPAGMVVHPAPGHPDGTLVNALLHHFDRLPNIGGYLRPGIVHRIDKDTSGALAVTKSDQAHRHLAALFHDHEIERRYHALVFAPSLDDSGSFDTLHGRDPNRRRKFSSRVTRGRRAVTHYTVLERFHRKAALVECTLETGRTHQIRMHLSEANAPLLGDQLYGGKATRNSSVIGRQALHARSLGFKHVDGSDVDVIAGYPKDFQHAIDELRRGSDWR